MHGAAKSWRRCLPNLQSIAELRRPADMITLGAPQAQQSAGRASRKLVRQDRTPLLTKLSTVPLNRPGARAHGVEAGDFRLSST